MDNHRILNTSKHITQSLSDSGNVTVFSKSWSLISLVMAVFREEAEVTLFHAYAVYTCLFVA